MSRVALLALAAVLLLSGCGSSNARMIPADKAQALKDQADQIAQKTTDSDCGGAERAVNDTRALVTELPATVSIRLKANLVQWVNHLALQVPKDCTPKPSATPSPTDTPAPTETPTPSASPDKTATPTPTPSATDTPAPDSTPTVQPPSTGGVTPGNATPNGNG